MPEPRPGTVRAPGHNNCSMGQPLRPPPPPSWLLAVAAGPRAAHTPADPHLPPQCITSHTRHLKINSSLQMPDRVLNFIKDHFLMDSPVRSQPLLLQSRLRYQQIGVHRAQGLHGTYDVLFLGTGGCSWGLDGMGWDGHCVSSAPLSTALVFADDGRLHKAVHVNHRVHIIEEIHLFPAGQPVLQLLLDHDQAGAGHGRCGVGARGGVAVIWGSLSPSLPGPRCAGSCDSEPKAGEPQRAGVRPCCRCWDWVCDTAPLLPPHCRAWCTQPPTRRWLRCPLPTAACTAAAASACWRGTPSAPGAGAPAAAPPCTLQCTPSKCCAPGRAAPSPLQPPVPHPLPLPQVLGPGHRRR